MNAKVNNVVIQGISSYVPENVEDNMDFVSLLGERKVKKQIRLTGIRKRHTSKRYQMPSDLAAFAAEKLMTELGWNKEEIGVLIFVTQGGDYIIPSTAICLQERLGLPNDCIAFDINLGCSAFNYGVHTTATLLNNSIGYKKALCLIADRVPALETKHVFNKTELSFGMLSGSAASAVALEKEDGVTMLFQGNCDGSNYDAILKTSHWRPTIMKGNVVFDFAINDVSQYINDFKKNNFLHEEDIDYYVFHQAQKLIIDSIVSACELPKDKVLLSMEEYGNTSGASVPLTVCANATLLKKKKKVRLLLCGFGVGLSCGITYLEMRTDNILEVNETDELYHVEELPKEKLYDTTTLLFGADKLEGEFIAELLSYADTSLILCGQEEEKLKALQNRIHKKLLFFTYRNQDDFRTKLQEIVEEPLDGVVNIDELSYAEILADSGMCKDELSVVLVGENQKGEMSIFDELLREKIPNVRVNKVSYKEGTIDFYVPYGNESSWTDTFIERDLPSDMIRARYLYNAIEFLLYRDSKFVSGTEIQISDKIMWN